MALLDSSVVTVVGPDARFATDERVGAFVAKSPVVQGSRRRLTGLVDARIPVPDLRRDNSPLLAGLLADGLASEFVTMPTEHTRWFTQVGSSRPGPADNFRIEADAIAAVIVADARMRVVRRSWWRDEGVFRGARPTVRRSG